MHLLELLDEGVESVFGLEVELQCGEAGFACVAEPLEHCPVHGKHDVFFSFDVVCTG